jgi:hypothetical protein
MTFLRDIVEKDCPQFDSFSPPKAGLNAGSKGMDTLYHSEDLIFPTFTV